MPTVSEALLPFTWGSGGTKKTREQLERERRIADALRVKQAPEGPWSLLGSLAREGAAAYREGRADKEEQDAMSAAEALWKGLDDGYDKAELMQLATNEWLSPPQSAVAGALLQQEMTPPDPMKEIELEQARLDLEQDRNPPPAETYRPMTPEERTAWGIAPDDPTPYAIGPDNMPKALGSSGGQTINVGTGGGEEEFYTAAAKKRGEMFVGLEEAGIQAQAKMGQIKRLEELLSTAQQGGTGAWIQGLGEFGIPSEGLDDIQAATALINKMVPEQRQPGTGPMSDADIALFKQSVPRIINQPGGNALIIQTLTGIATYDQQIGAIAERVLNREITPAEGKELMSSLPNPLEQFKKATEGGLPPGVTEEDIEFTMKKYGVSREEVLRRLGGAP